MIHLECRSANKMRKSILSPCILHNLCTDSGYILADNDATDASPTLEQGHNGYSPDSLNAQKSALRKLVELKSTTMLVAMKL